MSPNAIMYEIVPSNAAPVIEIDEGEGIIGGRRECMMGIIRGESRNVVAPDAIAIAECPMRFHFW